MSAAFDTVYHELLLERKPKHYRVKGSVLKLVPILYQHSRSDICIWFEMIDGIKSKVKELRYGVSQGSVLAPML